MDDEAPVEVHHVAQRGRARLHHRLELLGGEDDDHRVLGAQVPVGEEEGGRGDAHRDARVAHQGLAAAGPLDQVGLGLQEGLDDRALELVGREELGVDDLLLARDGEIGHLRVAVEVVGHRRALEAAVASAPSRRTSKSDSALESSDWTLPSTCEARTWLTVRLFSSALARESSEKK